jgi:hypothetical protein
MGQDRRLAMDLESGLFRMLDEGLAGYLAGSPDAVSLKLDWGDRLTADLVATRAIPPIEPSSDVAIPSVEAGQALPPALAALVEERRAAQRAAAEAAIRASIVPLPPATWREIQDRASSVGVDAQLRDAGTHLHVSVDLPSLDDGANGAG